VPDILLSLPRAREVFPVNKQAIFFTASIVIILFLLLGSAFETFALIWLWFGIFLSGGIFFTTVDEVIEGTTDSDRKLFHHDKTLSLNTTKFVVLCALLLTGHLITAIFYALSGVFIGVQRRLVQNRLEELGEVL
jgi:hypothetical protein